VACIKITSTNLWAWSRWLIEMEFCSRTAVPAHLRLLGIDTASII